MSEGTTVKYDLLTIGSKNISAINGTEKSVKNAINDIVDDLKEISSAHSNCLTSISSIDSIQSNITKLLEKILILSNNMRQAVEIFRRTEELFCNIASDEYQARDGKFYSRSSILGKYWGDTEALKFTYNEATGTYLISEGGVAMGFTTASALAAYLGISETELKESKTWSATDMRLSGTKEIKPIEKEEKNQEETKEKEETEKEKEENKTKDTKKDNKFESEEKVTQPRVETTSNKDINLTEIDKNSRVGQAYLKYQNEIDSADYATLKENLFTTTKTTTINGQEVELTHVVINDGSQINGTPANGSYGSGLETASSAAQRVNSDILINGSHFDYSTGQEDLKGANHVVIVNGEIKQDGVSGGNELLLDSSGRIYNASGKSAQQLVDEGVKYSFSCHSTQVIENGDTSPSYREGNLYKRNVIGMVEPGEYYIVTDITYNNRLSDTAEYLKDLGCTNAYSLDQGGSVTTVRNNQVINNPSDETGERAVGDFLYFNS